MRNSEQIESESGQYPSDFREGMRQDLRLSVNDTIFIHRINPNPAGGVNDAPPWKENTYVVNTSVFPVEENQVAGLRLFHAGHRLAL